jgi:predicted SAM-dependent methyltransferase
MLTLIKRMNAWLWQSKLGLHIGRLFHRATKGSLLSERTRLLLDIDLLRLNARLHRPTGSVTPTTTKLHLGCGKRTIPGWWNVDLVGGNQLVDLACGELPWPGGFFEVVVSQQLIEHLDLFDEALPLLKEVARVCKPGAEIWLGCPDLEKACRSYVVCDGADLLEDFITRFPKLTAWRVIPSHMVNALFHQGGEHKNLYDFRLLSWVCDQAGLVECRRVSEDELREHFPEFPSRGDDPHSIYICAKVPTARTLASTQEPAVTV